MASIKEKLAAKKNTKEFSSGFDVNTSFVASTIDETSFMPRKIDFNSLSVSPFNTYGYLEEEIDDLIDSILSLGLLDYLIVEMQGVNKYEILSGQKRFLALTEIKKKYPEDFIKLFPDEKIPCRVVDFSKFSLLGETIDNSISVDTKRMFIIAAGNQQHEKTAHDYMLQVEQMSKVYKDLKEKGLIKSGTRQREFVAEHTALKTRNAQKVINALKTITPVLWEALKQYKGDLSISTLEEVSRLPEDRQKQIADKLIKDGILDYKSKDNRDATPSNISHDINIFDLQTLFGSKIIIDIPETFNNKVSINEKDLKKIEDISLKIEKLRISAEKTLKKYK